MDSCDNNDNWSNNINKTGLHKSNKLAAAESYVFVCKVMVEYQLNFRLYLFIASRGFDWIYTPNNWRGNLYLYLFIDKPNQVQVPSGSPAQPKI